MLQDFRRLQRPSHRLPSAGRDRSCRGLPRRSTFMGRARAALELSIYSSVSANRAIRRSKTPQRGARHACAPELEVLMLKKNGTKRTKTSSKKSLIEAPATKRLKKADAQT